MSNKAIEINNLSYAYKSDWTLTRKPFLKDISLSIEEGEAFGFLGHNGAGKTTTIKCILGLIKPLQGETKILGLDSQDPGTRKHVGFLPEQPYFYDHLKIHELLGMYAKLIGMEGKSINGEVDRVLEKVNLSEFRKRKMRALSKGQTQRVGMAQAILGDPKVLILDEPFSGLDPLGRKELADLLFELKKDGVTMMMSSHILKDVEFLCNRVSIMSNGEIDGVYNLNELSQLLEGLYDLRLRKFDKIAPEVTQLATNSSDQGKFLHLTFDSLEKAEKALSLSVNSEAIVDEFKFTHGGLEELFIKITNKNN